MWSFSVYGLGN